MSRVDSKTDLQRRERELERARAIRVAKRAAEREAAGGMTNNPDRSDRVEADHA